jgi:hypothetical protein
MKVIINKGINSKNIGILKLPKNTLNKKGIPRVQVSINPKKTATNAPTVKAISIAQAHVFLISCHNIIR